MLHLLLFIVLRLLEQFWVLLSHLSALLNVICCHLIHHVIELLISKLHPIHCFVLLAHECRVLFHHVEHSIKLRRPHTIDHIHLTVYILIIHTAHALTRSWHLLLRSRCLSRLRLCFGWLVSVFDAGTVIFFKFNLFEELFFLSFWFRWLLLFCFLTIILLLRLRGWGCFLLQL